MKSHCDFMGCFAFGEAWSGAAALSKNCGAIFWMRVLVIRPGALGDTLMLLPAIDQLRHQADLYVMGRLPGLGFLRSHITAGIDFEGPAGHRLFSPTTASSPVSYPKPDTVVAFLSDPTGRLKRDLRIAFPESSVWVFSGYPSKDETVHVAYHLARCFREAGFWIDPERAVSEAVIRPIMNPRMVPAATGPVIFHPGSGSRKKNLPPEFWLSLGRSFMGIPSPRISGTILLLGPAEEDLLPFYREQWGPGPEKVLFSPANERLFSLMKRATLYLGHDSGITHLAAMTGTPTVALFRNADVRQWRPLGPAVQLIPVDNVHEGLIRTVLEEAASLLLREHKIVCIEP
jgi:heptosyltransferase-2